MAEDQDPQPEQADRAAVAQAEAELAAARAETAAARRELLLAKAGVDTSTPGGGLLLDGYKGELEVDKIREYAIAVGIIPNPAHTVPEIPAAEQAATAERQALAQGAEPGIAPEVARDPIEESHKVYFQAIKDGAREEEALGFYANLRARAAMNGDERVTVDYQMEQRRGRRFRAAS